MSKIEYYDTLLLYIQYNICDFPYNTFIYFLCAITLLNKFNVY